MRISERGMSQLDFHFRSANSCDSDSAYDLFVEIQSIQADTHPELFRRPAGFEEFEAHFENVLEDPDRQLVFACIEGRPVGYVQYSLETRAETLFRPERRFAYVDQLTVSMEFRRRGCARGLIGYVKNEAHKSGVKFLGLDVWTFNGPALACFENLGFQQIQKIMRLSL